MEVKSASTENFINQGGILERKIPETRLDSSRLDTIRRENNKEEEMERVRRNIIPIREGRRKREQSRQLNSERKEGDERYKRKK